MAPKDKSRLDPGLPRRWSAEELRTRTPRERWRFTLIWDLLVPMVLMVAIVITLTPPNWVAILMGVMVGTMGGIHRETYIHGVEGIDYPFRNGTTATEDGDKVELETDVPNSGDQAKPGWDEVLEEARRRHLKDDQFSTLDLGKDGDGKYRHA